MAIVRVEFTFTCEACDRSSSIAYGVVLGDQVPRPVLPEGWEHLDGKVICDRHTFDVRIVDWPPREGTDGDLRRSNANALSVDLRAQPAANDSCSREGTDADRRQTAAPELPSEEPK